MNNSEKKLIWLTIFSFLIPPILVVSIMVLNTTLSWADLTMFLSSWQFYFAELLFILFMPIIIWQLLKKSQLYKKEGDIKQLNKYYSRLQWYFVVSQIMFGLTTIPLAKIVGFNYFQEMSLVACSFLFLFITIPTLFVIFVHLLDNVYEDLPIDKKFPIKQKFRIVTIFTAFGGVGICISSAVILLTRYVENDYIDLTIESITSKLITIGIIVLILIIIPNYFVTTRFSDIFAKITLFLTSIGSGDLRERITDINSRDEFGVNASQLNNLSNSLTDIVSQLSKSSSYLLQSGSEFKNVSQDNSNLAERLASSAEEIAASLEQISANLKNSNDHALSSVKINEKSAESMKIAQDLFDITYKSISDIENKVKLIEEIADQTNLLAINAFIEAANAGEQGKGFAVLARSIRNLADESIEVSHSIKEVTTNCLNNSTESKIKIDESVEIANTTIKLASEISNSSNEQLFSVEQVNEAISHFNESIQSLVNSSQHLYKSSDQFVENSNNIDNLINTFKISSS